MKAGDCKNHLLKGKAPLSQPPCCQRLCRQTTDSKVFQIAHERNAKIELSGVSGVQNSETPPSDHALCRPQPDLIYAILLNTR